MIARSHVSVPKKVSDPKTLVVPLSHAPCRDNLKQRREGGQRSA